MRRSHAVAGALLSGALLAGCAGGAGAPPGKDGKDGGAKPAETAPKAPETPEGPTVLLTVPAAYDAAQGWQEELTWLPREYSSKPPVAVGTRSGVVAYLTTTEDGFHLKVRQASTGKAVFSGRAWHPPAYMSELGKGGYSDGNAELPGVATAYQDGREYVVVWAHGVTGQDALTTGKEIVRLAVYPADASGTDVAPLREIDVPVRTYGANEGDPAEDLQVEDRGSGLQVFWNGPALTGNNTHGAVAVDLATGTIEVCGDACANGAGRARTGKGWLVSGFTGGFEVPGVWSNLTSVPPGAAAANWSSNDGELLSTAGGNALSRWRAPKSNNGNGYSFPVTAVHDTTTGKVRASMACAWVSYGARPGTPQPLSGVISPNGRFLADGSVAFDLQRLHGTCLTGTEDRKTVVVTSVTDDGIAYGRVAGQRATEQEATTQADLTQGTGTPTLLPAGTTVPTWALKDTGVFLTPGPAGGLLVSALKHHRPQE